MLYLFSTYSVDWECSFSTVKSGTDALQAASYHYFLAKFVGQVCIDEKLILRGAEGTSTSVDDSETPAQILMNIALTNFDMLRSKFKNYCSKHESEADEDDDTDDGNVEDEEIYNRVDAAWFQGRRRFLRR